jgi:hypothetical protein
MKSQPSVGIVRGYSRKFHIYIGIFLLTFILFFSFSGLILNHSGWKFTSFWNTRRESQKKIQIVMPAEHDSITLIREFRSQLDITGEISNVKITTEGMNFRVVKPGYIREINVDFRNSACVSKDIRFNWWGKIRNLHTFNGSDKAHPDVRPNWIVTVLWRLVMDFTASGLIILCISSWIMWFGVRKKYPAGMLVLALGFAAAMYFVFILRLL